MSKFDEFFENTNIPLAIENYCHETWNAALDAAAKVALDTSENFGVAYKSYAHGWDEGCREVAAAIERLKEGER